MNKIEAVAQIESLDLAPIRMLEKIEAMTKIQALGLAPLRTLQVIVATGNSGLTGKQSVLAVATRFRKEYPLRKSEESRKTLQQKGLIVLSTKRVVPSTIYSATEEGTKLVAWLVKLVHEDPRKWSKYTRKSETPNFPPIAQTGKSASDTKSGVDIGSPLSPTERAIATQLPRESPRAVVSFA